MSLDPFDRPDWWDAEAFPFGLHELLNPVRMPYFIRQFATASVRTVLDIGCGGGFVSHSLAATGLSVSGIDQSASAVMSAVGHTTPTPPPWFTVGDAHQLPFGKGSFDGVVLSEVLEHVANPEVVFGEAARVLAPGGLALITGPNRTLLSRIGLIWLAQEWPTRVLPRGLHDHKAFVRPAELRHWAQRAALEPVDVTGIAVPLRSAPTAARAIWRLRRGDFSYADAARLVPMQESRSTAVAYMATIRKPG